MRVEQFWSTAWLFILPALLTAVCLTFLPQTPVMQLPVPTLWTTYWLLTRPTKQTFWPGMWTAVLCETAWDIPPGACLTFFILFWRGIRFYRDLLPIRPTPYHGLLCGVVLLPLLYLWIWLYALLWPLLSDTKPLMPSLINLILLPAVGALGGSAIFALAQQTDFLIFTPNPQDLREDEN